MPEFDDDLDRPMEDEIRRYARSADASADYRAIAQRAMATPVPGRGPTLRVRGGIATLAAAALIVVVVAGLLVLRPEPSPLPIGGSPTPSAAPTAGSTPSAAASAVPSTTPSATPSSAPSSAAPSRSPVPSATPAPSPSAAPSAQPTPAPTPTAPTAPASPVAPVPSDFSPQSVTFVSPDEGFVLGSVQCGAALCPKIAHTIDAGRTWSLLSGAPAATVVPPTAVAGATTGVRSIRFADPKHGWIFGPELWATSDGGSSWTSVALPQGAEGPVQALEAAAGHAYAVTFDQATAAFRIVSSAVGSEAWTLDKLTLPVGGGPVPVIQLVLSRDAGWILQNDRTVVNGARLVGGTWRTWQPMCADVVGPAYLAAATPAELVAACDVGQWATPMGTHLFASSDGGATVKEIGTVVPVTSTSGVATPDASTVVVAGVSGTGSVIEATFDRGASWKQVENLPRATVVELGFTTATQGVAVAVEERATHQLLMTRDGGHTWSAVLF